MKALVMRVISKHKDKVNQLKTVLSRQVDHSEALQERLLAQQTHDTNERSSYQQQIQAITKHVETVADQYSALLASVKEKAEVKSFTTNKLSSFILPWTD